MRAAVFFAIFLSACSGYDDLALLEIDSVEPSEVEAGGMLRLHGRGFPLARAPQIRLRGSVHRPGMRVSPVDVRLAGNVRSESLIEIPITGALIDALGGRATLDAELRVAFRAADDHRDVFSAETVRVDFLPDTSAQLRAGSGREEQTEPLAARDFGVVLSREELGTVGVRVVSVDPQGLAALQGVAPDDRLVGLDGMSLYGWRDFLPDPTKHESVVLVARDGLDGVHALRWPHEATERPVDAMALGFIGLLGLLLGWLSPAALSLRAAPSKISPSVWLVRSSLVLIFAALLVWVSALQWTSMWILGLGTFAALFALVGRDRAGAISFAFAVVATLTVVLLARSASIAAIVAAQSSSVLHWYIFRSPASLLAFGVYLHALGVVASRPSMSGSPYCAAAAVLGAVLFLGGSPLVASIAGIAVLFAKAAVITIAASVFQMIPRVVVTCSGLGLGLAMLGLFFDLGDLFPQWSILSIGCVSAIAVRALLPPLRRESIHAIV